MDQEFTVLDNKIVGRNMYITRKIKDVKAVEVAEHLGISESGYTKYERGESQITIDIIQRVSQFLKVDPLNIISASHGNFVEAGNNSPVAINGYNETFHEETINLMKKLIENQMAMNEKMMAILEKK